MIVNYNKVAELAESYINGNKRYVREKVKRINKVEFVLLCSEIVSRTDNLDLDQVAFNLTIKD